MSLTQSWNPHLTMGVLFGLVHLAYGVYLKSFNKEDDSVSWCAVDPEAFQHLDKVIHERGRMAIMSVLMTSPDSSFTDLKKSLNMTDGNLSVHIRTLQEAGYLSVSKSFVNRKPLTTCRLTKSGMKAFKSYIDVLEQIVQENKGDS